ncbi:MAG: signal peptidase I, partial [Thermomicrobiaceae bacterium]|nr:signal peptidase I [Thermomicrobiaceae bacterium]
MALAVASGRPRAIQAISRAKLALGLLGSLLAGLALAGLILAALATQFFGFHALAIQTGSMRPALEPGDLILTRPVAIDRVKDGDIVLFESGDDRHVLVAHRVAGIVTLTTNVTDSATGKVTVERTRMLRTRGDANRTADAGLVGQDRLRGVVWLTIPRVGRILADYPVQLALAVVAALSGAAWVVW